MSELGLGVAMLGLVFVVGVVFGFKLRSMGGKNSNNSSDEGA